MHSQATPFLTKGQGCLKTNNVCAKSLSPQVFSPDKFSRPRKETKRSIWFPALKHPFEKHIIVYVPVCLCTTAVKCELSLKPLTWSENDHNLLKSKPSEKQFDHKCKLQTTCCLFWSEPSQPTDVPSCVPRWLRNFCAWKEEMLFNLWPQTENVQYVACWFKKKKKEKETARKRDSDTTAISPTSHLISLNTMRYLGIIFLNSV